MIPVLDFCLAPWQFRENRETLKVHNIRFQVTLTGNNVITLRKLTAKVTAVKRYKTPPPLKSKLISIYERDDFLELHASLPMKICKLINFKVFYMLSWICIH